MGSTREVGTRRTLARRRDRSTRRDPSPPAPMRQPRHLQAPRQTHWHAPAPRVVQVAHLPQPVAQRCAQCSRQPESRDRRTRSRQRRAPYTVQCQEAPSAHQRSMADHQPPLQRRRRAAAQAHVGCIRAPSRPPERRRSRPPRVTRALGIAQGRRLLADRRARSASAAPSPRSPARCTDRSARESSTVARWRRTRQVGHD